MPKNMKIHTLKLTVGTGLVKICSKIFRHAHCLACQISSRHNFKPSWAS